MKTFPFIRKNHINGEFPSVLSARVNLLKASNSDFRKRSLPFIVVAFLNFK